MSGTLERIKVKIIDTAIWAFVAAIFARFGWWAGGKLMALVGI